MTIQLNHHWFTTRSIFLAQFDQNFEHPVNLRGLVCVQLNHLYFIYAKKYNSIADKFQWFTWSRRENIGQITLFRVHLAICSIAQMIVFKTSQRFGKHVRRTLYALKLKYNEANCITTNEEAKKEKKENSLKLHSITLFVYLSFFAVSNPHSH